MKRSKEERRQRRRQKRMKKAKARIYGNKKYFLRCAVCKEKMRVDWDIVRVFCGDCIATDPQGVMRVKLGKSFQKITDAYKFLHRDDYLEAKEKRAREVKELMRAERKKKKIEKKIISNYIIRYHKKKQLRIDLGKKSRKRKRWIKVR